jgi:hypothetical protein
MFSTWLRLVLFLLLGFGFVLAMIPLLNLVGDLGEYIAGREYRGITNALEALVKMFKPSDIVVVVPPEVSLKLPQPGRREALLSLIANPWLFDMIQRSTLVILPTGLAFIFTAFYFQYMHRTTRFFTTLAHLLRSFFPLPRPRLQLSNGRLIQPVEQMSVYRFGGPATIQRDDLTTAVIEENNGGINVPEADRFRMGIFEILRTTLFLGEEIIEVNAQGRTRDGILLVTRRARFRCRLFRQTGGSGPNLCSVAEKMVYRHWLGNDWENPEKRAKAIQDLVRTELLDYISKRPLAEFINSLAGQDQPGAQAYLSQNELSRFAAAFTQLAGRYALDGQPIPILKLEWTGEGEWEAEMEAGSEVDQESRGKWVENLRRNQGVRLADLEGANWLTSVDQWIANLGLDQIAAMKGSARDTACKLLAVYQKELNTVLQTQPVPEPSLLAQIQVVLEHIERLLRSCDQSE